MKEESHDLQKIGIPSATGFAPVTMRPAFDAGVALTRLDERIARSPVGADSSSVKTSPTPAPRCGSTASSCISSTSSSTTPPAISAHRPTNSPSPATSFAPAGASLRSLRIGCYRQRVSEFCDRRRMSTQSTPGRWSRLASIGPRPLQKSGRAGGRCRRRRESSGCRLRRDRRGAGPIGGGDRTSKKARTGFNRCPGTRPSRL